jgi:hypothetical protein
MCMATIREGQRKWFSGCRRAPGAPPRRLGLGRRSRMTCGEARAPDSRLGGRALTNEGNLPAVCAAAAPSGLARGQAFFLWLLNGPTSVTQSWGSQPGAGALTYGCWHAPGKAKPEGAGLGGPLFRNHLVRPARRKMVLERSNLSDSFVSFSSHARGCSSVHSHDPAASSEALRHYRTDMTA